jgi:hypothetical protein
MSTRTFLERMTAAEPELASRIDAVAVHTYWETPADNLRALGLVEGWLDGVGLGSEELIVSEYGWRSGGPLGALTEALRATRTREYTDSLARTNCKIAGVFPHSWITPRLNALNPEHWFGLADPLTGAPLASGLAYGDVIDSFVNGSAGEQPTLDVCEPDVPPPGSGGFTVKPPVLSASASARFEYTATGTASWRCRLDQGGFEPCAASGADLTDLADGGHSFTVRPVNSVGVEGAGVTYEWTVDTAAPATEVAGPATTIDATAVFRLSSDDPDATFRCRFDSQPWRECPASLDDGGLPDGRHMLEAVAVDRVGNADATPADVSFALWSTPAAPAIGSGPAPGATTGRTVAFGFWVAPGATSQCRVDAEAFGPCTTPRSHPLAGLAHGAHRFEVRAVGPGGVASAVASRGWNVDAQGPQVSVTRKSKAGVKPVVFSVSASDPAGVALVQYRLDGGAWATAGSTVTVKRPGNAKHVLDVRAYDRPGNLGAGSTLGWRLRNRRR